MRRRRATAPAPGRPSRHGRHGRQGRSSVVRPPLPPLNGRIDEFDLHVGTAAEFLRSSWDELRDVSFEVGAMPPASDADGIPRWSTDTTARRIVIYRLPLERLDGLLREDDLHRRTFVEGTVFRAAAEYLGREPWDLGPGRYRL